MNILFQLNLFFFTLKNKLDNPSTIIKIWLKLTELELHRLHVRKVSTELLVYLIPSPWLRLGTVAGWDYWSYSTVTSKKINRERFVFPSLSLRLLPSDGTLKFPRLINNVFSFLLVYCQICFKLIKFCLTKNVSNIMCALLCYLVSIYNQVNDFWLWRNLN